ncbi:hypothetical protein SEA_AEGEUS_96 [Mycobacterium phage Aegeus]|nr:hypothetical protein SEA_BAUDELAIRE_96 [Mycobacterium phage Baudelaire]WKW86588.1 hypothetical protein SEA_AEGEUS_96 [Mycobacterium phage Aegeus]
MALGTSATTAAVERLIGEAVPEFKFTEAERSLVIGKLPSFLSPAVNKHDVVLSIERAVTEHRRGDVVGVVRKHGSKFAFAYSRGKHVLIETDPVKPAYKPASTADEAEIATWPVFKA